MKKEKIIINVAIFLILFFVLDLFFGVVYPGETRDRESYLYIIPSIVFYSLVYIFVLTISKNTKITNIAISSIIFIFAVINHIKILASGNPIFITDIEMLGQAGEISTLALPVSPSSLEKESNIEAANVLLTRAKSAKVKVKIRIITINFFFQLIFNISSYLHNSLLNL